ncbi:MAG: hypothetical protein H7836_12950 [Magnetococcus sp. YQC-3]
MRGNPILFFIILVLLFYGVSQHWFESGSFLNVGEWGNSYSWDGHNFVVPINFNIPSAWESFGMYPKTEPFYGLDQSSCQVLGFTWTDEPLNVAGTIFEGSCLYSGSKLGSFPYEFKTSGFCSLRFDGGLIVVSKGGPAGMPYLCEGELIIKVVPFTSPVVYNESSQSSSVITHPSTILIPKNMTFFEKIKSFFDWLISWFRN